MLKSEKGPNSTMKNLTEKKKIRVSYFFINNACMKFKIPSIHGTKGMRGLKSRKYTDEQTDRQISLK